LTLELQEKGRLLGERVRHHGIIILAILEMEG
jgi:hypothetical protein